MPDREKVMKKVILIFLTVSLVLVMSGCQRMDYVPETPKEKAPSSLLILETYGQGDIVVDGDTHVMYWMSGGSYNRGTLTLLVDEDGNPKIWNETIN